jgi:hypothetical protein
MAVHVFSPAILTISPIPSPVSIRGVRSPSPRHVRFSSIFTFVISGSFYLARNVPSITILVHNTT